MERYLGGLKMKWLTYSRSCGFNIVEAVDEQSAEGVNDDVVVLDTLEEIDEVIVKRIKELLE